MSETPLLTVGEVAARLRVKPKRVHQLVRDGELSCVQIAPRDRRFTEEQVTDFIESRIIKRIPRAPNIVDRVSPRRLSSPSKEVRRTDRNEITGDILSERKRMKEEMRSWQ